MFLQDYLGSSAFGDSSYLVDLARYTTGTTDSSLAVYHEQIAPTTVDITMSAGARNFVGLGLFTILIPLGIAVAAVVVYLKRRHL